MTGRRHPRSEQPGRLCARVRETVPVREILFVFRARLKQRAVLGQEVLAIVGIAIGVALLFASQVASASLDSSVRQLTRQLVGGTQYQLDARGPEGFPESVAREASRIPGVTAALPLLQQQATVIGPSGRTSVDLVGADPRFARLSGRLLRNLSARQLAHQEVIAMPTALAASIGANTFEVLRVQIGTRQVETVLGARLGENEVGGLVNSQVALMPLSYGQKLLQEPHEVSRVYIKVSPGKGSSVRAALKRFAVRHHLNEAPATFDAQLFAVASAPVEQGEALFSVISAIVGFLFAFNAMLLTVPERRRLIGMMRRLGYTPAHIVQTLVFEALIIGVAASALGLGLGEVLSRLMFHEQPGYLAFAFPVGSQRVVGAGMIGWSVLAGVFAATAGVLAPVRHALAAPLRSQADVDEQPPRRWTVFRITAGMLGLLVTTLIVLLRPQSAVLGVITLVGAGLALLPFLFRSMVRGFERIQQRFNSTATRLAAGELGDAMTRVRSLAVAATGALAVFATVAVAGTEHNLESGLDKTAREWNSMAAVWVSPAGEDNTLGTTPFPEHVATRLTGLQSVGSVLIYRAGFLNVGDRRVWVIAPPGRLSEPMPPGQLVFGSARSVNTRLKGRGWAVLSEALALDMHLRIGDWFTLPAPRPTRFRLAGLSTNSGWPPGAVVINAEDYARAWNSTAASALMVQVAPHHTPAEARAQILRALPANSGLAVQTASEREAQWIRISRQGFGRLTQIAWIVLIAAIAAMGFAMIALIWQRRERIAYLKRIGNSNWLLLLALFYESAVLLGSGCLIGALFGLAGELVISDALSTVTGFPISTSVRVLSAIFSFLIVSSTALAIVALPGYLATRVRATLVKPA
jgi:putative ABC transport system permease protein